jgi:hypothetical protein
MLYQKGTQRIEVIIRKEGGGSIAGANETDVENVGSQESEIGAIEKKLFGTTNKKRIKRIIKTNTTHALAFARQTTLLAIDYSLSGYGMKYGDQAYQENVQRQIEIGKDVTGVASSFAMGAIYGSWGGPVGTVLGASFATLSTATSLAVKYAGREREFNYKTFKENNSIEYQRARASINLTTGRLR